jgi:hypothetical protein
MSKQLNRSGWKLMAKSAFLHPIGVVNAEIKSLGIDAQPAQQGAAGCCQHRPEGQARW